MPLAWKLPLGDHPLDPPYKKINKAAAPAQAITELGQHHALKGGKPKREFCFLYRVREILQCDQCHCTAVVHLLGQFTRRIEWIDIDHDIPGP